jgi:hypothetical protein
MNTRGMKFATVAVLLTLPACGGGNNASSPSTTTSTTVPDAATDAATARSLLLVGSDLPVGWKSSPHPEDTAEDKEFDQAIADCIGLSDPKRATADIQSPDFELGDASVGSSANLTATRADFEQDVAALNSPKYVACSDQLFEEELKRQFAEDVPGATIDDVNVARVESPTYGEVTVALKGTVTISASDRTVTMYVSDYAYGQGRSEVDVSFFNVGAPFDPALEKSLLAKAVAKLNGSV